VKPGLGRDGTVDWSKVELGQAGGLSRRNMKVLRQDGGMAAALSWGRMKTLGGFMTKLSDLRSNYTLTPSERLTTIMPPTSSVR
jgi:hypothetical protein